VKAQTHPCEYKVGVDRITTRPAHTVNALAATVETEWLFRLDDDDLLDPDHVEVLSRWLASDADIVYTWCRVEGGENENQFQIAPNNVRRRRMGRPLRSQLDSVQRRRAHRFLARAWRTPRRSPKRIGTSGSERTTKARRSRACLP
jgi:hypothetical protein